MLLRHDASAAAEPSLFREASRKGFVSFMGRAIPLAASVALLGGGAAAQEVDNIDGTHTVFAGDHYADCTGLFCFSGPNWGNNGEQWYLLQTRLAARPPRQ